MWCTQLGAGCSLLSNRWCKQSGPGWQVSFSSYLHSRCVYVCVCSPPWACTSGLHSFSLHVHNSMLFLLPFFFLTPLQHSSKVKLLSGTDQLRSLGTDAAVKFILDTAGEVLNHLICPDQKTKPCVHLLR